ncbi:hypothetical protein ACHAWF_018286 [Thalassiosira exigua]
MMGGKTMDGATPTDGTAAVGRPSDPAAILPLLLGLSSSRGGGGGGGGNAERDDEGGAPASAAENERRERSREEFLASLRSLPFPTRLHRILSAPPSLLPTERGATWAIHGRCFAVDDWEALAALPLLPSPSDSGAEAAPPAGGGDDEATDRAAVEPSAERSAEEILREELSRWGFRELVGEDRPDRGSYHHPKFLRGREGEAAEIARIDPAEDNETGKDADGDAVMGEGDDDDDGNDDDNNDDNDNDNNNNDNPDPNEYRPSDADVASFLAFSGASDPAEARRYLEMAGGALDAAVGLYVDHSGSGIGAGGLEGGLEGIGGLGGTAAEEAAWGGMAQGIDAGERMDVDTSERDDKDGNGDEGDQEDEEPDFSSLAPLPLLPHEAEALLGPPTPAERMVRTALGDYAARRTIRRALSGWIRERRARTAAASGGPPPPLPPRPPSSRSVVPAEGGGVNNGGDRSSHAVLPSPHFLFRAAVHPSLPVRRAALATLARGVALLERRRRATSAGDDGGFDDGLRGARRPKPTPTRILREALASTLRGLLFDDEEEGASIGGFQSSAEASGARSRSRSSGSDRAEGGDPLVQLAAALTTLVCEGGFPDVVVGTELEDGSAAVGSAQRLGEGDIVAKDILEELSSSAIESFVAGGGLRWTCASVLRLSLRLAAPLRDGDDDVAADDDRAARKRLALLIDLAYRLVLYGSVPAAADRRREEDDAKVAEGSAEARRTAGRSSRTSARAGRGSSSGGGGGGGGVLAAIGGGAQGGGGDDPSPAATADEARTAAQVAEDRAREDRRRKTLLRVHALFWSSELPAANVVRRCPSTSPEEAEGGLAAKDGDRGDDDDVEREQLRSSSSRPLSPLACLVASHEALRSRSSASSLGGARPAPSRRPSSSSSSRSRGGDGGDLERCVAVLGRIVDPGAGEPVVARDAALPWGSFGRRDDRGTSGARAGEADVDVVPAGAAPASSSRKRERSASRDGRGPARSRARAPRPPSARTAAVPPQPPSSAAARRRPDKRPRTSSSRAGGVASLLERLAREEETGGGGGVAAAAASSSAPPSSASSAGVGGGPSSLFAMRYRNAMESMLRGVGGGDSPSPGDAAAAAGRDGSLGRILASAGVATASSSSRGAARGRTAASAASAAASRDPLRASSLAGFRVRSTLEDSPEGAAAATAARRGAAEGESNDREEDGEVDEEDRNDDDDDDDHDEDDVHIDDEEHSEDEDEDDEDASACSAAEEVVDVDGNNVVASAEDDEAEEDDDDEEDGEEDGDDGAYDEETDEGEDGGGGGFDDAVISLDEVNLAEAGRGGGGGGGHHHHPGHHPHGHRGGERDSRRNLPSSGRRGARGGRSSAATATAESAARKRERERAFLRAAMRVLGAQHPQPAPEVVGPGTDGARSSSAKDATTSSRVVRTLYRPPLVASSPSRPLLTPDAEDSLLRSACDVVRPPRKPLNLKIFLRRAPTQEEFFRGSLSRNPIGLSSLRRGGGGGGTGGSGSGGGGDDRRSSGARGGPQDDEPRVSDLRRHIAKDLQMEDSAELLELLAADRILDVDLKLRVVQQVLWRRYVEENATSASALGVAGAGPGHRMISTGGGLSMIFSSAGLTAAGGGSRGRGGTGGGGGPGGEGRSGIADDDAALAGFPPMVVTYRLAGVDGEATEDKVEPGDLEDPEALPDASNADPAAAERRLEKEFGITRLVLAEGRGAAVLLASVRGTISESLRKMRRDEAAAGRRSKSSKVGSNPSAPELRGSNPARERFARSPPCPGLVLLRHCANLPDNRKKMLAERAPTILLRVLLDVLNAMNGSSWTTSGGRRRRKRSSTFDFSSSRGGGSTDLDDAGGGSGGDAGAASERPPASSRGNKAGHGEGNPTTEALQEIIEMLASDISADASKESSTGPSNKKELARGAGSLTDLRRAGDEEPPRGPGGDDDEDRTLPLVLKSLRSAELSPPLRKVIAKLLPFLTYGQVSQSRELASYFMKHVDVERLGDLNVEDREEGGGSASNSVLANTFAEAAMSLPPVAVCDNLRLELIRNGFADGVRAFLVRDAPSGPPPWSPALFSKAAGRPVGEDRKKSEEDWKAYFTRPGLDQAFKILTGLCAKHVETQRHLASDNNSMEIMSDNTPDSPVVPDLLTLCHWLESTSDNSDLDVKNPNGILAETLLDALGEDNETTSAKIQEIRKRTRDRKRELAEERRSRALVGMSAFGTLVGSATAAAAGTGRTAAAPSAAVAASEAGRSLFVSVFSSLRAPPSSPRLNARATRAAAAAGVGGPPKAQPSWMAEMEAMADEAGATCAVCQEGRTSQPSELLGLYAYVKKVSVSPASGGRGGAGRADVDGTSLLLALPAAAPLALLARGADGDGEASSRALFRRARVAADALGVGSARAAAAGGSSLASISGGGSRAQCYVTTVSAGNAIHCSCHKRAKAADRNHPKAPKSEWEGASLRNSRVTCNIILPLVSSKTSKVPLMAVETALAEYNAIVTNTLGARPKSILWSCLHDLRLLLLRMAHGEALGADCGGGSSSSNFLLLLYHMYSADMFARNAEHDEPTEVSRHARGLGPGFVVGAEIVDGLEFDRGDARSKRLERGVADAAPMAALCSILFFNGDGDDAETGGAATKMHDLSASFQEVRAAPSPARLWERHKSTFLAGLIRCAGRRHSLGATDSGCATARGISSSKRNVEKARSFADWSSSGDESDPAAERSFSTTSLGWKRPSRRTEMIEEYSGALRPMITLYAVFDALSREFAVNSDDERTEESSERLAAKLESCYKAEDLHELLRIAEVDMGKDAICKNFEKGATS